MSYQASGSSQWPVDESVAQQKVEATAENNACSNHSSGYKACVQRNRECIEKGSDAQVIYITFHEILFGQNVVYLCENVNLVSNR